MAKTLINTTMNHSNMDLTVDVICEDETLVQFCKFYNLDIANPSNENIVEIFMKFIDTYKEPNKEQKKEARTLMFSDVKLGNSIAVQFIPSSQKYIDYYTSIQGTVIFKDDKNENLFIFYKHNNVYIFKSLVREGCHYLGMTRGYEYIISTN